MSLKYKNQVILAKIEGTYGTDSVPTGVANAILASELEISALEADLVSRDLVGRGLGNQQQLHVGVHVNVTIGVEFSGAGAAGDVPAYGPLLRACAHAETITAVTDVQYDPVSSNEEAVSCYFFLDGQKHALLGARGSMSWEINAKGIPHFKFEMIGLWVDPASVVNPTPDFTAFQTPLVIGKANTPTFSLHGFAANLKTMSFNQNADVAHEDYVGYEEVTLTDRAPSGSALFVAPGLTTKNFFTIAKANTLGAVQLIHGQTAGAIVQFDAPAVQVLSPAYADERGVTMLSSDLSFTPTDAADDDYKITIK